MGTGLARYRSPPTPSRPLPPCVEAVRVVQYSPRPRVAVGAARRRPFSASPPLPRLLSTAGGPPFCLFCSGFLRLGGGGGRLWCPVPPRGFCVLPCVPFPGRLPSPPSRVFGVFALLSAFFSPVCVLLSWSGLPLLPCVPCGRVSCWVFSVFYSGWRRGGGSTEGRAPHGTAAGEKKLGRP